MQRTSRLRSKSWLTATCGWSSTTYSRCAATGEVHRGRTGRGRAARPVRCGQETRLQQIQVRHLRPLLDQAAGPDLPFRPRPRACRPCAEVCVASGHQGVESSHVRPSRSGYQSFRREIRRLRIPVTRQFIAGTDDQTCMPDINADQVGDAEMVDHLSARPRERAASD